MDMKSHHKKVSIIAAQKPLFKYYNMFAKKYFSIIPFTYYWYLTKVVGNTGNSLIDFGCGWGDPAEVLQSRKKRHAVGVDIYDKYLEFLKNRHIYDRLLLADISKYRRKEKYDIVLCSHVLEHLPKVVGQKLIKYFESIAIQKIVLTMPVGELPQHKFDGNKHQKHLSKWFPQDLIHRGYRVYGFSPKFIYGKNNVIKKMGVFGFFLFFLSYILEPIYVRMPERCVYMLAVKEKHA
jgi:hypothetical protein